MAIRQQTALAVQIIGVRRIAGSAVVLGVFVSCAERPFLSRAGTLAAAPTTAYVIRASISCPVLPVGIGECRTVLPVGIGLDDRAFISTISPAFRLVDRVECAPANIGIYPISPV